MIPTHSFVAADQSAHVLRHLTERRRLTCHHVRVEVRWPAHGLAGVVDDEVQAVAGIEQLAAERLDARRVTEVETEDLESMSPLGKIGFIRVPHRRIARKTCRDDETRAASKELQPGLVADLDATAGQERDSSPEIGALSAFREVQRRTRWAQLIVEVVDGRVLLLAHVADAAALGFRLSALGLSGSGTRDSGFGTRAGSTFCSAFS